jgi:hypothetical protein
MYYSLIYYTYHYVGVDVYLDECNDRIIYYARHSKTATPYSVCVDVSSDYYDDWLITCSPLQNGLGQSSVWSILIQYLLAKKWIIK